MLPAEKMSVEYYSLFSTTAFLLCLLTEAVTGWREASWVTSTAASCSSVGSEPCLQLKLLSNETCKKGNACGVTTGAWKEQ